jgi:hypothetical protein
MVDQLVRREVEHSALEVCVGCVHRGELDHLAGDDSGDGHLGGGLCERSRARLVRDRPAAEDRVRADEQERGPLELCGRLVVLDELHLQPGLAQLLRELPTLVLRR